VPSKSYYSKFDFFSSASKFLTDLLDDMTGNHVNSSRRDVVHIAKNESAVYLVRSYSGAWGWLSPDPDEHKFVIADSTNRSRHNAALRLNIAMASIDGLSILIPAKQFAGDPGLQREILKSLTKVSAEISQIWINSPEPPDARTITDSLVKAAATVFDDVTEYYLKKSTDAAVVEATTRFSGIVAKISSLGSSALSYVNQAERIITIAQLGDRVAGMAMNVTPIETAHILNADLPLRLSQDDQEITAPEISATPLIETTERERENTIEPGGHLQPSTQPIIEIVQEEIPVTTTVNTPQGTKVTLVAPVNSWSVPVVIPNNHDFVFTCEGCETGTRMQVMINGDIITSGNTKWYELPKNMEGPLSIRFKANGTPTTVWVEYNPKQSPTPGGDTTFYAPINQWSAPIIIPAGSRFTWAIGDGCDSKECVTVLIKDKEYLDGIGNWIDVGSITTPATVRFKSNTSNSIKIHMNISPY
jgi:hypothetical protein